MTPEEGSNISNRPSSRFVDIQREQADVQPTRAQTILEVTEKLDVLIDVVAKLVKRNGH
jgi:hypothetical protein